MYTLISYKGIYNEAITKYIVDNEEDLVNVPTNSPAGSQCFVIENSDTYMLNHKKEWVKIKTCSGSIIDLDDSLILDGGSSTENI